MLPEEPLPHDDEHGAQQQHGDEEAEEHAVAGDARMPVDQGAGEQGDEHLGQVADGGDDAGGGGLSGDKVHRHLFARQSGNKVYMHHGKASGFVDAAHNGGDITDISI